MKVLEACCLSLLLDVPCDITSLQQMTANEGDAILTLGLKTIIERDMHGSGKIVSVPDFIFQETCLSRVSFDNQYIQSHVSFYHTCACHPCFVWISMILHHFLTSNVHQKSHASAYHMTG